MADDYDHTGRDVPLCLLHANEEWSYKSALDIARRVLWQVGPQNGPESCRRCPVYEPGQRHQQQGLGGRGSGLRASQR